MPKQRLEDFQALFEKHYGIQLQDAEAFETLSALLGLLQAAQQGGLEGRLSNAALVTNPKADAK